MVNISYESEMSCLGLFEQYQQSRKPSSDAVNEDVGYKIVQQ